METASESDMTADSLQTGDAAQATVTITIDESKSSSLAPGFMGYNTALVWGAVSYLDENLQKMAAPLGIGWLRYPAGTGSDAFDWTTGQVRPEWASHRGFSASQRTLFLDSAKLLAGSGGLKIDDMNTLVGAIGAKGIIVCINAFTDTPQSAGEFAAYAKSHNIPVLAWELANEPFYFKKFFSSPKAYLNKMRPFRDAIKQADPDAVVAVSAIDAGHPKSSWDKMLKTYRPKYWDAVVVHHYLPVLKNPRSADVAIKELNAELHSKTTKYVKGRLANNIGADMPVLITEYNAATGKGEGGITGTLYGGIYAAEYALRMAQAPQVKYVGAHQLMNKGGIGVTTANTEPVLAAYAQGKVVDTTKYDFGFFVNAQAAAYSVAALATADATLVLSTAVAGGGKVKNADGDWMPTVFAQAFKANTKTRLVLTNKGASEEIVAITDSANAPSKSLSVVTVTGPDRLAVNSKNESPVAAVKTTASGTVRLPAYSVVSVTW
ncbi:MAG TPA: hypothetical protein VM580_16340 [Labilithrix sp.]|nr:hypothetical protein [Labilithrix sp.]